MQNCKIIELVFPANSENHAQIFCNYRNSYANNRFTKNCVLKVKKVARVEYDGSRVEVILKMTEKNLYLNYNSLYLFISIILIIQF